MSSTPAELHFNGATGQGAPVYRGDDFSHAFTFYTDEAMTVPRDLTALTLTAQVRRNSQAGSSVVATFTIAVSGAGNNVATLSLPNATTGALVPGQYRWDYQEETAGGLVTTRFRGELLVMGDVTR